MNINSTSFKGTFWINRKDINKKTVRKMYSNKDKLNFEIDYCANKSTDELFLHVPIQNDLKLMQLLSKLQINFKRMRESDVLAPENIVSRMVLSNSAKFCGAELKTVDVRQLDKELRKNPESYVGINGANGSQIKYERLKKFFMTNQPIAAPTVYLQKTQDKQIITNIYDGRHRFAVLRDLGLNEIPVAMDKESQVLAKEIGLI